MLRLILKVNRVEVGFGIVEAKAAARAPFGQTVAQTGTTLPEAAAGGEYGA